MSNELKKVDAATAHTWLEEKSAILIDVRETDEYVKEHIPEAHLVPLSGFNREDFPEDHDKIVIFHCQSGGRTNASAARILATGFKEVYQLENGLKGWHSAGFPVNVNLKAPISIMRQVQITAGSLIVLGIVLSVLFNSWFLLLSLFVGAGLVQAGYTGNCALAAVLGAMPWNKVGKSSNLTVTSNQPS